MRSSARLLYIYQAVILTCAIMLIVMAFGCSKSTGVDDEDTDRTPPTVVSDLSVVSSTSESAMLRWTTPEDHRDDGSGGMVDDYDLRVSFDSITAQNFASATVVSPIPVPLPAGQVQQWPAANLAPDSVHYFAIKSKDDRGNWSEVSNCVWTHCAAIEVVLFADSVLEYAVRNHISKLTGDILTSDVDTIWQLVVQDAGIVSLVGLGHFSSLQVANFTGNEINVLSPLAGLPHLGGLYIARNQISDLSPLTGMKSLRQIHLDDNPVTDISPLATIDSLQQLILWGTQVTDFSPLYGLYFLSDVGFDRMNLSDISFMSHLKRPQRCGLAFNQITSVEPLWNMYTLEALNLMQNQISDIAALSSLIYIKELRLDNNQISDLTPLHHNTGLDSGDVVYLEGNPLSPYSQDTLVPTLRNRGVVVYY